MEKSNKQQVKQIIMLCILFAAFAAFILSLTACLPVKQGTKYTPAELGFIGDMRPVMNTKMDTELETSLILSNGKNVCRTLARGVSADEIITIISRNYSDTESRAMYAAAKTYFCP